MHILPRNLRLPLLTALVMLGASWAQGEASACPTMKAGASCETPCGCCKTQATAETPPAIEPDRPGIRALDGRVVPVSPVAECGPATGPPCACRADERPAPDEGRQEPRPSRPGSEDRSQTSEIIDLLPRGDDAALRAGRPDRSAAALGRPDVPIYLRDARLLF